MVAVQDTNKDRKKTKIRMKERDRDPYEGRKAHSSN
jgi:hypothetical protein